MRISDWSSDVCSSDLLPLLGLIDSVLPNDMRPREMKRGLMADLPVWLATILAVGLYFMAAFWVRSAEAITPWQYAGAILSLAWMSVVPLVDRKSTRLNSSH